MPFKLTIQRLGFERTSLLFDDQDTAVEHAVEWFLSGYPRRAKDEYLTETIPWDIKRLRGDLRNGREFQCGRFEERASVAWTVPQRETANVDILFAFQAIPAR